MPFSSLSSYRDGRDEKDVLAALPVIAASVFVSYDLPTNLALAPFIIDLDPKTAKIRIEYRPAQEALALLFDSCPSRRADDTRISSRTSKEVVPKAYEYHVTAVDPNDSTNQRAIEPSSSVSYFTAGLVSAQRSLINTSAASPMSWGSSWRNCSTRQVPQPPPRRPDGCR